MLWLAVSMLTKCMALDMATAGVRVNAVSPAWIWSPEVAKIAPGECTYNRPP